MRAPLLLAIGLGLLWLAAGAAEPSSGVGESIYRHGVLSSGAPLEGVRQAGGVTAKGSDAACVNCHQRSGLGTFEGYNLKVTIPPITGLYLFHSRKATTQEPILPYLEWMHGNRDPYTEATLARAIREGVDSQGRPLSYLMPRFVINDADMASLIDYLKKLDAQHAPGVTDTVMHFATVITPDVDPARRRAMLDVMEHYVADKNQFPIAPSRQLRTSGHTEYAKSMFHNFRRWQLHVWDLTGPASTWQAQLQQHMSTEPVFALLSGLGGSNWAPVHEFCEKAAVPCLFPNVEVPVDNASDFYPMYLTKGVLLEADLVAQAIANRVKERPPVTVQQVYRAGDSGEAGASALAAALKAHGIAARSTVLPAAPVGQGVAEAVRSLPHESVLVLWLRAADLAALGDASSAPATVYVSGLMGGLERSPLPPSWRGRTKMTYPYDLPGNRDLRLRYALNWFSMRHIPVVDEPLQVNTYLACGLLAETLSHMADNLVQPFLVEMLQSKVERRLFNTGYYPRIVLGWNQHFISKGGYLVHFAQASGSNLVADSDWTVP